MQKNLIMALLLTSLIWIVWYTWIVPPQTQQTKKVEISEVKKYDELKETKELKTSQNTLVNNIKSFELKASKTRFVLTSSLSIMELFYSGPVQEINLIPDSSKPFLSFYDLVKYREKLKKQDEVSVSGKSDVEITKKLVISNENELNRLIVELKNTSPKTIKIPESELTVGPGLNTVKSEENENPKIWKALYAYNKKERKNPVIEKLKSDYKGEFIWAGIENRYFIFAVLNDNKIFSAIKYSQQKINDNLAPMIRLVVEPFIINAGESKRFEVKFYAGPKDYDLLKKIGYGLHLSIDFGVFAPLAKIANSLLKRFYAITKNYGVSIILLSILVQIIMLPLTFKSYRAMAIMKKMQPEMRSIQERYKNDPKRMNMELMNLYRRYGANPFSGCWPMLLQIPIFFALFTTLRNSWDLHGARFILWIKDLSDKDPYFVLPILMGALMFLQNYLTPQTTQDASQALVMKWMPIVFTFLFLTFPSGLVIYWIVNSLFSITLNYYLKQKGFYS
ncbi:MAG: membrane protein insertase YidC [Elusimicrobiales bacterium]